MMLDYSSSPENILAVIGPCISTEIYEVGNEVIKAAQNSIPNAEKTWHKNNQGKFHFNLHEANRQLLLNEGLKSNNIEIIKMCSFVNHEHFFSARRDGVTTGKNGFGNNNSTIISFIFLKILKIRHYS